MTGFGTTFDQQLAAATKTSGLAITSLIFSLILCCPVTTIIGPLLGLGALVQIGSNPALKGRALAFAAIIIGVGFSLAQGFGMYQVYGVMLRPILEGPATAFEAGFAGNPSGFTAEFHGAGATAGDAEVQAFIDELRQRYGEFQSLRFDESGPDPQSTFGDPGVPFPYVFTFDNGEVSGEAVRIFADETTGLVMKWGAVTVFDPDLGDLTYPLSAVPSAPLGTQFAAAMGAEDWATAIELYWDSAGRLNEVAWKIVDDANVKNRDFDLAMKAAKRANELTEHKNAALLDTLARVYYETGDVKSALKWQRLAAENLKGTELVDDVRGALKKYEQASGDDGNGSDETDDADTDDEADSDPDAGDGD